MSAEPVRPRSRCPTSTAAPALAARRRGGESEPDPRRDRRGDRRARRDPVHEGHARGARLRLLGAHGRRAAVARGPVRRRRHPARPAHPPGALGALELADDPAAVRATASWSAAATSSPRCTSRASSRRQLASPGRCCSVPRRMACRRGRHRQHPLPAPRASPTSRGPPGQPVRRLGTASPQRELEMAGFDAFYERLRTDPELPTTSQPSIGDFLAVWEPLLDAGRDVVSIHLAGGISGTCEAARQAQALLAERGARRARRGDRRRNRLRRRSACWCSRRRRGAAAGADRDGGRRARARGARGAAHLVLRRHARVPAPRRAHRPRPGVARRHAEDQADPLARVRDHAGRARAHGRAARSSAWSATPRSCATPGSDGWVVQHIQAPEQAERLIERCREIFDSEPVFTSEVGPVIGTYTGPGPDRRRRRAARAARLSRAADARARRQSQPRRRRRRSSAARRRSSADDRDGARSSISCGGARRGRASR